MASGRVSISAALLGCFLLAACWTAPVEVDLREDWLVDLTIRYDSTSVCTVTGAVLHVEGLTYSGIGSLEGGQISCTGTRTWATGHGVAADIWGPNVTIQLREPLAIQFTTFLHGEATPRQMSGTVRDEAGGQLGTWTAHRTDCAAREVALRLCLPE
ncbi:MAG TPA: hypothetical protein VIM84_08380 [Gemmatimonadales bacterium]